jgi:hypothetical protein
MRKSRHKTGCRSGLTRRSPCVDGCNTVIESHHRDPSPISNAAGVKSEGAYPQNSQFRDSFKWWTLSPSLFSPNPAFTGSADSERVRGVGARDPVELCLVETAEWLGTAAPT